MDLFFPYRFGRRFGVFLCLCFSDRPADQAVGGAGQRPRPACATGRQGSLLCAAGGLRGAHTCAQQELGALGQPALLLAAVPSWLGRAAVQGKSRVPRQLAHAAQAGTQQAAASRNSAQQADVKHKRNSTGPLSLLCMCMLCS